MMQTAIFFCALLASTMAFHLNELDNNIIGYEDFRPVPSISLPYPYHGHTKNVIVESVPVAPIHSDTHTNDVPANTEITSPGLISTALSCTYDAVKAVIVFLLSNGPALVAGTMLALGICKLTPLCDSQTTIYEVETELRSFVTPERLTRAAKFVREAVQKFNNMQKK